MAASACLLSPPPAIAAATATATATGADGAGASTPGRISAVLPSSKMSCLRGPLGASWNVTDSCLGFCRAGSLPKIWGGMA